MIIISFLCGCFQKIGVPQNGWFIRKTPLELMILGMEAFTHMFVLNTLEPKVECLPVFVANSNEMLVLWDDTYFQRLWCNMEVACFIKHAGPERVRFLPLWIAPWLLSSMLLDLISATIFEVLELSFPNWSMAWVAQVEAAVLALGSPPELTRFFAAFFIWMFSGLCYLPSSVPSFFSFRARLRSHTLLLEQMSSFRVQEAKCTEEWDRQLIEAQVVELYRDTGKSAEVEEHEHQHELERFNSYIQGPLRKVVLKSIGDELSVPYHLCLIAYLPMTFYSAVNVLGCDNGPCMRSVKEGGFSSLELYLMVQAVAWLLCMLLAFPMTHPTLLFLLHKFSPSDDSPSSSTFAALISCLVAFAYGFFLGACIWGIAFCLADGITVIRLLVTVVVLASLLFQTYMIFLKPRGDQNKIGGGWRTAGGSDVVTTPPGPSCEKAMDRSASKHKSDDIRRDIRFTHFTHLYGFTGSPFFHKVDARHLSNQTSEVFFG